MLTVLCPRLYLKLQSKILKEPKCLWYLSISFNTFQVLFKNKLQSHRQLKGNNEKAITEMPLTFHYFEPQKSFKADCFNEFCLDKRPVRIFVLFPAICKD